MNSIIWKGVLSTTIKGLIINELPPISKPEMRVMETVIDGRNGSIIEDLGFNTYDKAITIGLHRDYDIDEVIKYFSGEGEVVFSNESDKVYRAKIYSQIDYNRLLRYRQAVVLFRTQPFKYAFNEELSATETGVASGSQIYLNDVHKLTSLTVGDSNGTIKTIGKNLFKISPNFKPSTNGLTNVINEDGSITTSGVPTASYVNIAYCTLDDYLINGHTYTMSQKFENRKVYMQVNIQDKSTGGYTYLVGATEPIQSFVANTDKYKYTAIIQTESLANYGTEDITSTNFYQIEEGSVATEFEDYVSAEYQYSVGDGEQTIALEDIEVFEPCTTIINTNKAEMSVEYIKPFNVENKGLEESFPKMTITGNGTVEISVNGVGIFSYTFPDGENEVYIDSEKEDAYLGDVLKNRNMNGEFPILIPRTNKIEWSGDIESISILPRSRWL